MAQREGMPPRPMRAPAVRPGAPSPPPDRMDALLEERFSRANVEQTARQLAEHDRQRPAPPPTAGSVSGVVPLPAGSGASRRAAASARKAKLSFQGAVPERLQQVLKDWLPALLALAERQELGLLTAGLEIQVHAREAYERQQGPLAAGLKLPASSYRFNAVYRTYTVHLVLPERVQSTEEVLSVLRALLTRVCGDIFLREEVFSLESYREAGSQAPDAVTVGMAEKLLLLEDLHTSSPALDKAVADYASVNGINARRTPGPARKAFFKSLNERLEKDQLSYEYTALVDEAFAAYQAELRRDLPAAIAAMTGTAEQLNAQTLFLPPEEAGDYAKLKQTRPDHFLRSAKLRLEFALETVAAAIEEFDALDAETAPVSPLADERIQGLLQRLEQEHLARPYLVPGARLGPELERQRKNFPLEVHALLVERGLAERSQQALPIPDQTQAFKTLSHQLQSSLMQRAYQALLLLRQGIRLAERRQGDQFRRTEGYRTLKGLAANFRFRRPLLQRLFVRIGIVLDLAEAAPQEAQAAGRARARQRFPVQGFARAWGNYAAHFLIAQLLEQRGWKGFQPQRYWAGIDFGLAQQIAQAPGSAHLTYLLRRYQGLLGEDDLAPLVTLLRNPSGTLRFAVGAALAPAPAGQSGTERVLQLDEWAAALLAAQQTAQRNAIVVERS